MEIHICKICGKPFLTRYKQAIYCDDKCREEAARRRDAARSRAGRWKKHKADYMSIYDIIRKATQLGMSYGEFVSMRSIGKI